MTSNDDRGRTPRRRTVRGAVALLLGLTGAAVLPSSPASATTPPVIRIVQSEVRFDDVFMGGTASRTVTLVNDGPGTATGVRTRLAGTARFAIESTSCGAHVGPGATLAEGAACTITLSYSPFTPNDVTATLRATAGGGSTSLGHLVGTGRYDEGGLRVTPTRLDFGRVPVGTTSATQTVTVTNQGPSNRAVHVEGATPVGSPFEVASRTCTTAVQVLAPGGSCTVTYRFRPTAAGEQLWWDTMNVRTAPEGHVHPVPIELTGRGGNPATEPLRITPRRLDFGDVPVGSTAPPQTVTITNTSAATVSFGLAGGGAGEFGGTNDGCVGSLASGASCTYSYAATASRAGTFTGWTSIDTIIGGVYRNNPIEFVARGTGGPTPRLHTSVQAIDLGSGGAGASATVTVTNSGSAALTGVGLTRSVLPAAVGTTHTCPSTLAAGASCTVTATYAPGGTPTEVDGSFRVGSSTLDVEVRVHAGPRVSVHERFVRFAYAVFLDRYPTATEASTLAAALDAGSRSRASVVRDLAGSPEWVRTIVGRMYRDTLGREGEPSGVAYWTEEIRSGRRTVAQVAGSFYASPEYFNGLGGGAVDSWVADLYLKLLKRSASPSDVTYWSGEVAGKGRTNVAVRMFQSPESGGTRVANLYEALLFRGPDAAGRDFWVPRVLRDGDVVLAVNLASSEEFFRLAQFAYTGG